MCSRHKQQYRGQWRSWRKRRNHCCNYVIAGGIVSIATRNSKGKGGNIAVIVLFGLGAIMGFTMAGSYTDLIIWAAWCAICAVLALISMIKKPKQIEEN